VLISNQLLSNSRVLLRAISSSFFIVAVFHPFTLELKDGRALANRGAWLYWAISFNVLVLMLDSLGRGRFLNNFHLMSREVHSSFRPVTYILVRQNLVLSRPLNEFACPSI
jgi:hypothetical protein